MIFSILEMSLNNLIKIIFNEYINNGIIFFLLLIFISACNENIVEPEIKTNTIFYTSDKDGNKDSILTSIINHDVFSMSSNGEDQINLTNSPNKNFWLTALSTVSKKILFSNSSPKTSYYLSMNINGTQKRIVTSTLGRNFDASLSPDGQYFVFVFQHPQNDIVIKNINGTTVINLTSKYKIEGVYPKFSYDGEKICFTGYKTFLAKGKIFIIDRNGSNLRQLTQFIHKMEEK